MEDHIIAIFFIIISYYIGSIPTGVIIAGYSSNINLMEKGSKNIGATNVARLLGTKLGIITFIGDMLKGALPSLLSTIIFRGDIFLISISSIAPLLGHCYSPFLKFRGGKGVATGCGIILILCPISCLSAGIVWIIVFLLSRKSSLSSLLSIAAALSTAYLIPFYNRYLPLLFFSAFLIVFRHRENIKRLIKGEEKKFGRI